MSDWKFPFLFAPLWILCVQCFPVNAETLIERIRSANYQAVGYAEPLSDRFSQLKRTINLVRKSPPKSGAKKTEIDGFSVEVFEHDNQFFWLIGPIGEAAEPYIVIAEKAERDVIFEAPHPVKDRATGIQAILLLQALRGRAAIISGNNRCASEKKSRCSGRTRVCSQGRTRYPISDPAHSQENLFHATHVLFSKIWPKAIFVQLHGFSGRGTKTKFVLSDGSRQKQSKDGGIAGRTRDEIRKKLGQPELAVSCQDTEDDKYDYRKLCARTNVQGRQLNGSSNVCRKSANKASGRFLHIEQQWSVRKPVRDMGRDALAYHYMAALKNALRKAVPQILNR